MFDIGGGELIFIVLVVLFLFGPKKIPEVAKMIKKGLVEMKKAQSQFQSQIDDITNDIQQPIKDVKKNITLDQMDIDVNNSKASNENDK